MALRDQPYIPLYIQDIMTDEKLNECSAASHGIYIKGIMCLMHKSEDYGKILLKQKDKQTDKQIKNFACKIAKHTPYSEEEIEATLIELLTEKVLFIEGDYLCQKRMIKDNYISEQRALAGTKGGLKTQKKEKNFASKFAKAKVKANSEYEYVNENVVDNNKNKGAKIEKSEIAPSVFLSADQVEQSKILFDQGYLWAIETLSNYKLSSGKKYKSDFHALKGWVYDKYKKEKLLQNGKPGSTTERKIGRIPISEAERFMQARTGIAE